MKKVIRYGLFLIGGLALVLLGAVLAIQLRGIPTYEAHEPELKVQLTNERIEHGRKLSSMLCTECHANNDTRALTGKFLSDLPEAFGKVYSRNITGHPEAGIGSWTDGQIAYLLRTGIRPDGQYIPPYMPKFAHMSDEDMASIIAYLRSDNDAVKPSATEPPASEPTFMTKMLCNVAFKPLPYPEKAIAKPAITDQVAYGKYIVTGAMKCYDCHSADFKTNNDMQPEQSEGYLGGGNALLTPDRNTIYSANITPDPETGIGKWTEDEFLQAVKYGRHPSGRAMRAPMPPYLNLEDAEIRAVYVYLKSVSPIKKEVNREVLAPETRS